MSSPDDDKLIFNGLPLEQRHRAAVKQTTAAAKELAPFLITVQSGRAPNPKMQREAVDRGLEAQQGLLRTLLLDELFAALIVHKLGPPPPNDAPNDAHNLRAIQELHVILDWLAEIAPRDSIDLVRADLKRLEDNQEPQVLRRDNYVDRRFRDHTELKDREAGVLLVYYLAAKGDEKIPDLLKRLIGDRHASFAKLAAAIPLEHRHLMTAAGKADREGVGLSPEQQALLSKLPRCRAVINRHDAEVFPDLAELSDEDIVRKLFARAFRFGNFARSERPRTRLEPVGLPARKARKRLNKTVGKRDRNTL